MIKRRLDWANNNQPFKPLGFSVVIPKPLGLGYALDL